MELRPKKGICLPQAILETNYYSNQPFFFPYEDIIVKFKGFLSMS